MEVRDIIELQKEITGIKDEIKETRKYIQRVRNEINYRQARLHYLEVMIEGQDC